MGKEHRALGGHTWGSADISREEPVSSFLRIQAHQVELPEVGHVEHSGSPSAGQTLLLDLKSSREEGCHEDSELCPLRSMGHWALCRTPALRPPSPSQLEHTMPIPLKCRERSPGWLTHHKKGSTFKRIKITHSMFLDHDGISLGLNSRRKIGEFTYK